LFSATKADDTQVRTQSHGKLPFESEASALTLKQWLTVRTATH